MEEQAEFMAQLSAPARRALQNHGITTLKQLANLSKAEVLKLHGMGKGSIPKMEAALHQNGFAFKEK